MTDNLNKLLQEIDDLNLSDLEIHRKRLESMIKYVSSPYSKAPLMILESYTELSLVIEKYKINNPKADISIYDKALDAMKTIILYCEHLNEIYSRSEYQEQMIQTQSIMINDLQSELQQYYGIEQAILNNTFKDKLSTIIKKLKK